MPRHPPFAPILSAPSCSRAFSFTPCLGFGILFHRRRRLGLLCVCVCVQGSWKGGGGRGGVWECGLTVLGAVFGVGFGGEEVWKGRLCPSGGFACVVDVVYAVGRELGRSRGLWLRPAAGPPARSCNHVHQCLPHCEIASPLVTLLLEILKSFEHDARVCGRFRGNGVGNVTVYHYSSWKSKPALQFSSDHWFRVCWCECVHEEKEIVTREIEREGGGWFQTQFRTFESTKLA